MHHRTLLKVWIASRTSGISDWGLKVAAWFSVFGQWNKRGNEGDLQDFVHGLHAVYREFISNIFRNIRQVLLVVFRDDDCPYSGSMCRDIFSFNPPIGSTLPRSVISPVMATSLLTGIFVSTLISDVAMVIPAEGPSFGMAPSGT